VKLRARVGVKKKNPQKKTQPRLKKGKKKCQLEFATLVSLRTRTNKKGAPMSAPSIHIGALVGASLLWLKISTKLKII